MYCNKIRFKFTFKFKTYTYADNLKPIQDVNSGCNRK